MDASPVGPGPGTDPAATLDLVAGAPGWQPEMRRAVKAIALAEDRVLLLRSTVAPGVKLPGGGIQPGEDDRVALERELREETGRALTWFGTCALTTVEQRSSTSGGESLFRMQSRYYPVAVSDPIVAVRLDDYEHHLGLHPVWLTLDDALAEQRAALADPLAPAWARRELLVLEWLAADEARVTGPSGSG